MASGISRLCGYQSRPQGRVVTICSPPRRYRGQVHASQLVGQVEGGVTHLLQGGRAEMGWVVDRAVIVGAVPVMAVS